jgi:hypothetical protein
LVSNGGATAVHHQAPLPNAADTARLQTLSTDALFTGSSITPPTPVPEDAGYDLQRGYAVTVQMGSGEAYSTISIADAHAELERVRSAGWTVVAVQCQVDPTFTRATLYAVKSIGSFTAALEDSIVSSSLTRTAYAPFHSEKSNPWTPSHPASSTCIDGPAAPTSTTQAIDTNIGRNTLV